MCAISVVLLMSLLELLVLVLTAGVCGAIGQAVTGASQGRCFASVGLGLFGGLLGALFGTTIARRLGLAELLSVSVGGSVFPIVLSILGASLLVAAFSLMTRRRRAVPPAVGTSADRQVRAVSPSGGVVLAGLAAWAVFGAGVFVVPPPAAASAVARQEPAPASDAADVAAADAERARSALERGDAANAERIFRRLLIGDPDDVDLLMGWSRALVAQARSAEAATGLLRAGERALRRGDGASAALVLREALQHAPQRAELRAQLWARFGRALLLEQRHLEAETALREALELDGTNPSVRLELAAASWENGRLQEAEEQYRAVVDRAASWPLGWFHLGRFLVWQGRFAEAIEPLERAQALGLDGVDVLLEHARALDGVRAATGDAAVAARAVAAWRRVVERAPDEAFSHYGLAGALRAAGDLEGARGHLERYHVLYQRDQERTRRAGVERARVASARAEIAAGRAESALAHLAELTETVEVLEVRARAELLLGRGERARRLLERALALEPGRSDLRRRLDELRASEPPA